MSEVFITPLLVIAWALAVVTVCLSAAALVVTIDKGIRAHRADVWDSALRDFRDHLAKQQSTH